MSHNNDLPYSLSYHEFYCDNLKEDEFFSVIDELPFNTYFERPAMLSLLPKINGIRILDAGCAAGWYTEQFISKGAEVIAIDISDNMLGMAKKRIGDKAVIMKADLNKKLSFIEDGYFDLVFSSLTLDYIENWNNVMGEFNRILNSNGKLIFSVQHPFEMFSIKNIDTYYQTILCNHEYNKFGKKTLIRYYKRPLNEIINPVINAGFCIEQLSEPKPTNEFKELCPEYWNILVNQPEYLIIKATKIR